MTILPRSASEVRIATHQPEAQARTEWPQPCVLACASGLVCGYPTLFPPRTARGTCTTHVLHIVYITQITQAYCGSLLEPSDACSKVRGPLLDSLLGNLAVYVRDVVHQRLQPRGRIRVR